MLFTYPYLYDAYQVVANLGGRREGGHTNRVSCLAVSSDGGALCTGSWDCTLKVRNFWRQILSCINNKMLK